MTPCAPLTWRYSARGGGAGDFAGLDRYISHEDHDQNADPEEARGPGELEGFSEGRFIYLLDPRTKPS